MVSRYHLASLVKPCYKGQIIWGVNEGDHTRGTPTLRITYLITANEGTLVRTPNREPQEYSRNIIGNITTRVLIFYHIPTTFLGFPVWASH